MQRTELLTRTSLFSHVVLFFREPMSAFVKYVVNLITSVTSSRTTVRTAWGYGPTAVYTDPQVLLSLAVGEVAFTGGRRISEGVWSAVDVNGVPLSPVLSNYDSAQNLIACQKANPTATTGTSKSGDAASVLGLVDDSTSLSADGLGLVCFGNVYELDNSAGTSEARIVFDGGTLDAGKYSGGAYVRVVSGTGSISLKWTTGASFGANSYSLSSYSRLIGENITSPGIGTRLMVAIPAGVVARVILPQLENSTVVTTTIIGATDTAASKTRGPDINTATTPPNVSASKGALKIRLSSYDVLQNGVPFSFYPSAADNFRVIVDGTDVYLRKRNTSVDTDTLKQAFVPTLGTDFDIHLYWDDVLGFGVKAFNVGDAEPAFTATSSNTDDIAIDSIFYEGSLGGTLIYEAEFPVDGTAFYSSKEVAGW